MHFTKQNIILGIFFFRMCQEPVRRETTKGSSIEFIGCLIPQYEQNEYRAFSIFR